jgi:dihydrofolate reductase
MIVSAIAAMDKNNLIGIGLKMPWHLPKDFSYFKETTTNHPILMGRKTFESIGCRPLPNRPHVIISSNPELSFESKKVYSVTTVEDAIALAGSLNGNDEIFICGGGQIYAYAIEHKLIDKLYITTVHTEIDVKKKENPIYFPHFNHDEWDLTFIKTEDFDENNKYNMTFLIFERN